MTTKCYSDELLSKAIELVEKHIKCAPAYRFLNATDEPRYFIAIQAYKQHISWPYSFSLETVKAYDSQRPYLCEDILKAIKGSDRADRAELIELAVQQLTKQS